MKTLIHQSLPGYVRGSLLGFFSLVLILASIWGYAQARVTASTAATNPLLSAPVIAPTTTPSPSPTNFPLPAAFSLPPAKWIGQTYNNCGPATVAELLQYFGYEVDQSVTKAKLRHGSDDKNVTLAEISTYLRDDFGLESRALVAGDITTLKRLIAAGIPVVVENWLHPNEDIGHVLLLRGYDDQPGVLIGDDVYLGPDHRFPYDEFEWTQWQPFNRIYLPVYRSEQEGLVRRIVGDDWEEREMHRRALAVAAAETETRPENIYSWFNLGATALALGQEDLARSALEKSRLLGWPARLAWYRPEPIAWLESQDTLE